MLYGHVVNATLGCDRAHILPCGHLVSIVHGTPVHWSKNKRLSILHMNEKCAFYEVKFDNSFSWKQNQLGICPCLQTTLREQGSALPQRTITLQFVISQVDIELRKHCLLKILLFLYRNLSFHLGHLICWHTIVHSVSL